VAELADNECNSLEGKSSFMSRGIWVLSCRFFSDWIRGSI
jgi:hypothetical protein